MKKVLGSLALFGLLLGASGCSVDKPIANIDGVPAITQSEFYEKLKENYGEAELQSFLVNKVLEKEFGSKVTEEDIDKVYSEIVTQNGGEEALKEMVVTYGYTDLEDYKSQLVQNLYIEELVKASVDLSDEEYQEYFDNMLEFSLIKVSTESEAKEVLDKLAKKESFEDLAGEYSIETYTTEEGSAGYLDIRDDSYYPSEIAEVLVKLEDGKVHEDFVYVEDNGYFILRTDKNFTLGKHELKDFKEDIKKYVIAIRGQDNDFIQESLGKLLKKHKVVVSDETLKGALSSFNLEDSDNESSSSDKKEESTSSEKSEETSETEETVTTEESK